MAKNLVRDLVHRRVPQILGIYLGASWAVIEFVGMLVDRYLLSPHLVDLSIFLLASLIPMVALLAFGHGAPGRDGWTRTGMVLAGREPMVVPMASGVAARVGGGGLPTSAGARSQHSGGGVPRRLDREKRPPLGGG